MVGIEHDFHATGYGRCAADNDGTRRRHYGHFATYRPSLAYDSRVQPYMAFRAALIGLARSLLGRHRVYLCRAFLLAKEPAATVAAHSVSRDDLSEGRDRARAGYAGFHYCLHGGCETLHIRSFVKCRTCRITGRLYHDDQRPFATSTAAERKRFAGSSL